MLRRGWWLLIPLGVVLALWLVASGWAEEQLFGGVAVQVYDPSPGTMSWGEGILVCIASSRVYQDPPPSSTLSFLHIQPGTPIVDRRGAGPDRPAGLEALRRGQQLRARLTGGVLFSYPSQIFAERLFIDGDGADQPLDCEWESFTPG